MAPKTHEDLTELQLRARFYDKLRNAMGLCGKVGKDAFVSTGKGGGFKAVSHDAVVGAVRQPLLDSGLVTTLSVVSHSHELIVGERKDYKTGQSYPTQTHYHEVEIRFSLCDVETGWTEEFGGFGTALDNGDKGYGKAVSYAKKYALLTALMLETGDDVDQGEHVSARIPNSRRDTGGQRQGNPPPPASSPPSSQRDFAKPDMSKWPEQKSGVPGLVLDHLSRIYDPESKTINDQQVKLLWITARQNGWKDGSDASNAKDLLETISPDLDSSKKIPSGAFFTGLLECMKRYSPAVGGGVHEPAAP